QRRRPRRAIALARPVRRIQPALRPRHALRPAQRRQRRGDLHEPSPARGLVSRRAGISNVASPRRRGYNRPLMPEKLDELAEEIAERALARLRSEDFGMSTGARRAEADCAPQGCEPCPQIHSCGARALFEEGATRLTPITIRTSKDLAQVIDHTMLKPDATREDIVKACDEARRHGFATVCVNPSWVELTARLLHGSSTLPIAVVAFPSGAATTLANVAVARVARRKGARGIHILAEVDAAPGGGGATAVGIGGARVGSAVTMGHRL